MDTSPFSSHHRPLLPPPFFLSPGSRLASTTPPHAPLPQRLYRPAPTSETIKFSTPSYSHSIARLAGIQTEMEVEMEKRNNDESQEIVDSSDNEHLKLSFLEEKKTGYKINRKSEKNVSKDEADMKKVRL